MSSALQKFVNFVKDRDFKETGIRAGEKMSKVKLLILLSPMISIAAEKPVSETAKVSNPSSAETALFKPVWLGKCSRGSLLSVASLASRVRDSEASWRSKNICCRLLSEIIKIAMSNWTKAFLFE